MTHAFPRVIFIHIPFYHFLLTAKTAKWRSVLDKNLLFPFGSGCVLQASSYIGLMALNFIGSKESPSDVLGGLDLKASLRTEVWLMVQLR